MALSFPFGIYTVFFTHLSATETFSSFIRGIYLFAGPLVFLIPANLTFGQLFLFSLFFYALFFVICSLREISIIESFKISIRKGIDAIFQNNANVVMLYTGAVVFLSGIIDKVQELIGIQTGSLPPSDPFDTFVGLTVASLREEFGFRMLLIGLVAFMISLPDIKKGIASLWIPSKGFALSEHKFLLAFTIALSSFLFGLAHFTSGSGWQIGKIPEATYAGILLGYSYYRYGFHVSVMIHWGVDYFGSVYSFFGQGFAGIPWDSPNGYILSDVVAIDLIVFLGISGTVLLSYKMFRTLLKDRLKGKENQSLLQIGYTA
jgi:hypothetical protein